MSDPDQAAIILRKRIAARLSSLARGPGRALDYEVLRESAPEEANYILFVETWIRGVWDLNAIVTTLVSAARRQRTMALRTKETRVRGRPVGPILWPRTVKVRLTAGGLDAHLDLVCLESSRHTRTPENVLLDQTLLEIERRVALLEREGTLVLADVERQLVGEMKRRVATAKVDPNVEDRLHGCRAKRRPATAELERLVEKRLLGAQPQAPQWARDLLEFRRKRRMRLPPRVPRSPVALYSALALIEVLAASREETEGQAVSHRREGALEVRAAADQTTDELWRYCYLFRERGAPFTLIIPLYIDGAEDAMGMLYRLLWRHAIPRWTRRWLIFRSRADEQSIVAPAGIDLLVVTAPIDAPPDHAPKHIKAWVSRPPGAHIPGAPLEVLTPDHDGVVLPRFER